jgi:hypothetical protein
VDPGTGEREVRWAGLALALTLVAIFAIVGVAPAQAKPREGRWVATGQGVQVNFVVTRAKGRLIAAHPVLFCGSYGEAVGEDFRPPSLIDPGSSFESDFAVIGRGGRFRRLGEGQLFGRVHGRRGVIRWRSDNGVEVPPELGGAVCPATAYRKLRAREVGPVRIEDGFWDLRGTLGSFGWLEVYGGGSLVQLGGTFIGPPSPEFPEVGPCQVDAGGVGAAFSSGSVPAPIAGSEFNGGVTVDVFGIVDAIQFNGQFTQAGWAYGEFLGVFNYAGEYTCGADGFWIARHKEGVRYSHIPKVRGPRPPRNEPKPPHEHWPNPPPKGPEDFRCSQGSEKASVASDLCKVYIRGRSVQINLLWGNKKFGFRHIRKRHGFSLKADSLIAQTLNSSPDPQPNGTTNYEHKFGSGDASCVVRAVVAPNVGLYTAFVLGYPDGRFSRCP